ncbi:MULTISPECIES: type I restriction endonuclease [Corynebacterium]|uniref:type I restriction endonuclease n=1 Tax=Corynebacterium TaxID=1716 RepID=UPI0008A25BAE|nr:MULTISPECIES: type I restriction endonuclease [Corynebacterium]MDK8726109.1 type I restriction endonuclease [Corynebacterium amycolatum]OFL10183.1 restriction endonuclease [Corynebacterium sp. HMSC063F04]
MVNPILEEAMELTICRSLNSQGWIWNEGDNDKGFDPELGLFPEDVLHWLKTQHPKEYERAIPPTANDTDRRSRERRLLNRLTKELDYTPILDGITKKVNGGLLGTLRDGFSFTQADLGTVNFPDMAGFFPYDPAKTEVTKKAKENRLRVLQQVHFEKGDGSRIDLVLLVNGIPVVTMELKTDNTQSIDDAVAQYKHDRKPNRSKRPLLNPGRCLVHFAVSSREVMMTTELNGADTVFLPFNQGTDEGRAGNPDNPNGYRVSYLWEWVCSPDLLLRILKDYALWEPSTKGNEGRLIFPRFHQLRSVERVTNDVAVNGTGRRYLIQHSAGSGKTKTIAWMAHRANKMIHEDGTKLFDCVIVVTDRTVLDKNVADGLSLLQASEGMVINITNDDTSKSEKLNHYLTQGKRILSCTLQTFPALAQTIDRSPKLRNRRWLVIIDEAHSSQHGKASRTLLETLSDTPNEISEAASRAAAEVEEAAEGDTSQDVSVTPVVPTTLTRKEKDRLQQQRDSAVARSSNVTIVALTATPKAKTLAVFGEPAPDEPEKRVAFDLYSMAQAIDENFILDVLQNYFSLSLYAKIVDRLGREDEVVLGEAKSALKKFVRSHEQTIHSKAEVAVEHFNNNVRHLLGSTAKAMVVCDDRMSAYTWFRAVQDVIKATPKYQGLEALVAFSGSLDVSKDEDAEEIVTESSLNNENSPEGKRRMETTKMFDGAAYKFLIVANKYQTGFDEPRLSAMYVDKPLAGVMAVQTLSRLNRTMPSKNKSKTFVVDFVNDPEAILKAFQPYYSQASIDTEVDPNVLTDLARVLDTSQFYGTEEMETLANVVMDPDLDAKKKDRLIRAGIDPIVTRWTDFYVDAVVAGAKDKETVATDFRANLVKYVHAWDFMSQFIDFQDVRLHKRAIFADLLVRNLKLGKKERNEDYVTGVDVVKTAVTGDVDKGRNLELRIDDARAPLAVPGFDGRVSTGGAADPLQGAFREAVEQVNELFSAAGIDMSKSANARMVHAVWEALASDKDVEVLATKNPQDVLAKSSVLRGKVLAAILAAATEHKQFTDLVLGGEDALDMFTAAMSRLAVAAIEDKVRGIDLPADALVGKPQTDSVESEAERRVQELYDVMLMHAGENPVEEDLARALDQALVNREDTNVFEVVRKQFIQRSLPVAGQFFEGVAMYAVQQY